MAGKNGGSIAKSKKESGKDELQEIETSQMESNVHADLDSNEIDIDEIANRDVDELMEKISKSDSKKSAAEQSLFRCLRSLVQKGRNSNSAVTYDDISKVMPNCSSAMETEEMIEDIVTLLGRAKIDVVGSIDDVTEKKKKSASSSKSSTAALVDDSLKMYMMDINKRAVLLNRDQEIDVAKAIENGKSMVLYHICRSTMGRNELIALYDDIVASIFQLREVFDVAAIYHEEHNQSAEKQMSSTEIMHNRINDIRSKSLEYFNKEEDGYEEDDGMYDSEEDENLVIPISTIEMMVKDAVIEKMSDISDLCVMANRLERNVNTTAEDDAKYNKIIDELFEKLLSLKVQQNIKNTIITKAQGIFQQIKTLETKLLLMCDKHGVSRKDFIEVYKQINRENTIIDLLSSPKYNKKGMFKAMLADESSLLAIQNELSMIDKRNSLVNIQNFLDSCLNIQKFQREVNNAKTRLTEANLRLVISIAKNHHKSGQVSLNDVIQEGNIGLMKAVDKFDYRKGFKFSTYATWWIKQSIARSVAEQSRQIKIPSHMIENSNKLSKTMRDFEKRYGRKPSLQECAKEMAMTVDKIKKILRIAKDPISLNQSISADGSGNRELSETIASDNSYYSPINEAESSELQNITSSLLSTLTFREERVLRMRFGISGAKDCTLEEVGASFNVTRERIRQIEAKALRKMRHPTRMGKLSAFFSNFSQEKEEEDVDDDE